MKKRVLSLLLVGILIFSLLGCSDMSVVSDVTDEAEDVLQNETSLSTSDIQRIASIEENAAGKEQLFTESSQSNFNKVQPPKKQKWSLERKQLNDRNERWNDPNKISYIYLFEYGRLVGYYPIKGKVSSVNSKLTANEQLVYIETSYNDSASGVIESPSMDGSYGTNGDAIFFFLTDGTYMEWNGTYLLFDEPMKLNVKPLMTYQVQE